LRAALAVALLIGRLLVVAGVLLWYGFDLIAKLIEMDPTDRALAVGGFLGLMFLSWHIDRLTNGLRDARNEIAELKGLVDRLERHTLL
jgi:hypothetical protein